MQEDPIGFAGGDPNLYRYEGNGPANGLDPSGLWDFGEKLLRAGRRVVVSKVDQAKDELETIGKGWDALTTQAANQIGRLEIGDFQGFNESGTAFGAGVIDHYVPGPALNPLGDAMWGLIRDPLKKGDPEAFNLGGNSTPALEVMTLPFGGEIGALGRVPAAAKTGLRASRCAEGVATGSRLSPELAAQWRLIEATGDTPEAHYLARHSPLLTDSQLLDRAVSGIDPWTGSVKFGKNGKPILYPSAKFNTYQDMLEAIERAQIRLQRDIELGFKIPTDGTSVEVGMFRDIGVGYERATGVFKSGLMRAKVIFDKRGQVISAYPLLK
jgi:hypothetical protein